MKHFLGVLSNKRFAHLFCIQGFSILNQSLFIGAILSLWLIQPFLKLSFHNNLFLGLIVLLFQLPSLLFSGFAVALINAVERSRLMRALKFFQLFLAMLSFLSFYLHSYPFLMLLLFLWGIHNTFYTSLKNVLLPTYLEKIDLITGNGLIITETFITVLLGIYLGYFLHNSLGSLNDLGIFILGLFMLVTSLIGLWWSYRLPEESIQVPQLNLKWNLYLQFISHIQQLTANQSIYLLIKVISWFLFSANLFLITLFLYSIQVLHANPPLIIVLGVLLTVGLGAGVLLCQIGLKNSIELYYTPIAALGISLVMLDFAKASRYFFNSEFSGKVIDFFSISFGLHISLDLLCIGFLGGIALVPLFAILQSSAESKQRAAYMVINHLFNSIGFSFSILSCIVILSLFSLSPGFLLLALMNLFLAIYSCRLLSEHLVRAIARKVLTFFYRVEVQGIENYINAGEKVVLLVEHVSSLDAGFLAAFLPDKLIFAFNTQTAKKTWLFLFHHFINVYQVNPTKPMSLKGLFKSLEEINCCVFFLESKKTASLPMLTAYDGPAFIAEKIKAKVILVKIEGAELSLFARFRNGIKMRWFPKIRLIFSNPCLFQTPQNLYGRRLRKWKGRLLYEEMVKFDFKNQNICRTYIQALIDAQARHGKKHVIAEDVERKPMTYQQLLIRSLILGRLIAQKTKPGEMVGVLLPTSQAFLILFTALHWRGCIPIILNFSSGVQHVLSACELTRLKYIYTSRRFVSRAKLEEMITALHNQKIEIIYLEDLRQQIHFWHFVIEYIHSLNPMKFYANTLSQLKQQRPSLIQGVSELPSVILFTSGSENRPKAVVLSHQNLLANCAQMASSIDFTSQDIAFNALPVFHSFGLTVGLILPLVYGVKVFLYPSPLHYRIVPELVYDSGATIFYSTDTFLTGYAKYARVYDFQRIRFIFAGAEKLHEETRRTWGEKFGVIIYEGYGVTEAAPVLSTNTPMLNQTGTVGCLLPGLEYRIEAIEGIKNGGRLWVRGPNIMQGYLKSAADFELETPLDGWHDTGDIVSISEEGFITLLGRAKRFAKIGGEMISLTAVENFIQTMFPDGSHAVIQIPNARKGEQLALFTTCTTLTRDHLMKNWKVGHMPMLSLPKYIYQLEALPILGSGKVNYPALQGMLKTDIDDQSPSNFTTL